MTCCPARTGWPSSRSMVTMVPCIGAVRPIGALVCATRRTYRVAAGRLWSTRYGSRMSEATGEPVTVHVAGHALAITSPDKVYFPAIRATKIDLVEFYLSIGDTVMRAMRNRPVLLQRFPNGSAGSSFFQKRMPDNAPDWLSTTIVSTPNGTTANALVINDLAHFIWAVNIGCLGLHSWPIRAAQPQFCDELRIDLDPGPGTTFAMAQETAGELHSLFDELAIRSYIKTTGNRGLHVYVRLVNQWNSIEVRSAAVAVARELA